MDEAAKREELKELLVKVVNKADRKVKPPEDNPLKAVG